MFALEINFQDGSSQPEMLLVRRPLVLIGASDHAHVVLDDLRTLNYQLQVVRDLGRKFQCHAVAAQGKVENGNIINGVYDRQASFDLGVVKLNLTALDSDLLLREGEAADRAGVRILRQACSQLSPLFPAVLVQGPTPLVMSFAIDQPLTVGRSKRCNLRLDSQEISPEHARIGFESGEFWVEDLGSTHGTYVNQQQVSGRVAVKPGAPIVLGREITILGVTSEAQIQMATLVDSKDVTIGISENSYPALISLSELVRPARFVIQPGANVVIGRDPSCDMWVGAPHVSRKHSVVSMSKTGSVAITDQSSNGLAYDGGMLIKGDPTDLTLRPSVFDFGGGITVALCFDSEQERAFIEARGSFSSFRGATGGNDGAVSLRRLKFWSDQASVDNDSIHSGAATGNTAVSTGISALQRLVLRALIGWNSLSVAGKVIFGFLRNNGNFNCSKCY